MYQFSNQPRYHNDGYQHCSLLFDQEKNQTVPLITQSDNFNIVDSQNALSTQTEKIQENTNMKRQVKPTEKNNKKSSNKTAVDTSSFSIEERLVAAVWVHERKHTKTSMSEIKHDFRQRFGREPPAKNTLLVWERKLFSTGSVCDAPRPGRPINRQSHVEEVAASMRTAPALSLRARALALRMPRTTLRTILHKDLPHILPRIKDAKQNNKRSVKEKPKRRMKRLVRQHGQTHNEMNSSLAASVNISAPFQPPAPPPCGYPPHCYTHQTHIHPHNYT